ncbi:rhamnulokinase [Amycolatopsis bartoniae]|uniref:Rhamnulokinase n=1 Tax=Amycolatopsis bartoniae TaxID=941986 RepID=A0A8H9M7G1_9PSEU|nr:rhamnulokinase family protein [Amycolatopsis bartoniae]MBB2938210.1 rhamnulokinase [Amycolatopsis bartoniae]TVT08994.1 rhamnulokinase [Amycolatopsis bartoniae]GHF33480.1 rhamnulokinase [Amycolatopsis bartoniae]
MRVAAVDLGASSGRVMAGTVGPGRLELDEVHRFPNGPVRVARAGGSTLYWDILGIYRETLAGLRAAGDVSGVGIDSWAVDYGLLDESGTLLGNPVHYRDSRTDGVAEQVTKSIPLRELFDVTGLQQLPFNTLYQLVSERDRLAAADTMLLIPDLLNYWLTGERGAERTNASTTQLFDVRSRTWALDLAERAGIPPRLLPPLREPGSRVGTIRAELATELGLPEVPVIAVGSHDTASAVVAVPAEPGTNSAYISSGTWSLVGLELAEPELSDAALAANFTNEGGVDGTIRFLRNVMGLWVLTETLRTWEARGERVELATVLAEAAEAPALAAVVDLDAPEFLPPGDMPARITAACRETGQRPPETRGALVRCIVDSLALAYRRTVRQAAELAGRSVDVVHVVGGGVRNELLCQLTADACGVPVLAGPVEAAALGNVLVQARALGAGLPDLAAMRALVRETQALRRYEPSGGDWAAAEARLTTGALA